MSARASQDHDYIGRGRVQVARSGTSVRVRVDALTTQARRLKPLVSDFLRADYRRLRPSYADFLCHIQIEHVGRLTGHDVDNVAKALLDALTRHVWHDDAQVRRLIVEKVEGERARIHILARPLEENERPTLLQGT